ncbi:hypothetical protein BDP27DRAFT_1361410 [Rhodocollybia butyracea]|uniref:Uncharacterized protein n=1 Tax=Rhodocollybia butyracea TaxID=206335 RepID=A0A9P5UBC7_9AGAR|nr:hypothetical protein BDP27DRAFT_1361410 [Rhodocollybia butyracea]
MGYEGQVSQSAFLCFQPFFLDCFTTNIQNMSRVLSSRAFLFNTSKIQLADKYEIIIPTASSRLSAYLYPLLVWDSIKDELKGYMDIGNSRGIHKKRNHKDVIRAREERPHTWHDGPLWWLEPPLWRQVRRGARTLCYNLEDRYTQVFDNRDKFNTTKGKGLEVYCVQGSSFGSRGSLNSRSGMIAMLLQAMWRKAGKTTKLMIRLLLNRFLILVQAPEIKRSRCKLYICKSTPTMDLAFKYGKHWLSKQNM